MPTSYLAAYIVFKVTTESSKLLTPEDDFGKRVKISSQVLINHNILAVKTEKTTIIIIIH